MAAAEPRSDSGNAEATDTPVSGAVLARPDSTMAR